MRDIGQEFMREHNRLFRHVCRELENASDRVRAAVPRSDRTADTLAKELKAIPDPEASAQFRDAIYRFYAYDDGGNWDVLHIHLPMNRDINWIVGH